MNDKKKKPRKNSAGVLSQNKVTDMKFIDFAELGKDAAELGQRHAKKNMRLIKKVRRKKNE